MTVDFDYERRGQVIDYVRERYGADHVAQIITFGTMAARGVLRDVGRVLGMSYQQTDAIAKMVPFELNMTLERALNVSGELRRACESDPDGAPADGYGAQARGHAAQHLHPCCGRADHGASRWWIICRCRRNDDVITTQFPMGDVEALGLLKMDFLGLRTLNVIMRQRGNGAPGRRAGDAEPRIFRWTTRRYTP